MLGSRGFNSFAERGLWVSNNYSDLAERFGNGRWTEEELAQLDWGLQNMIRRNHTIGKVFRTYAGWFNSSDYLDNLENVLYEAQLDKSHVKFREHYYRFFKTTIDAVQRHVNRRYDARTTRERYS